MTKAIDCSVRLSAQNIQTLKSAGIGGFGRYVGYKNHPNWDKTMTVAEKETIHRNGGQIFCFYETDPTHASYLTESQGTYDGHEAVDEMQALGAPSYAAVSLTVDFPESAQDHNALFAYAKVAKAAIGGRFKTGMYGNYDVVETLAHAPADTRPDVLVQTYAWSDSRISTHADIYQYKNDTFLAGISVDLCDIRHPIGLWPETVTPPNPAPVTPHIPHHTSLLKYGAIGGDVSILQSYLIKLGYTMISKVDAIFGANTLKGVKQFQHDYHINVDGAVGPTTWSTLERAMVKHN